MSLNPQFIEELGKFAMLFQRRYGSFTMDFPVSKPQTNTGEGAGSMGQEAGSNGQGVLYLKHLEVGC